MVTNFHKFKKKKNVHIIQKTAPKCLQVSLQSRGHTDPPECDYVFFFFFFGSLLANKVSRSGPKVVGIKRELEI